jgi:iodotyrosine deiodinase
LARKRRRDLVRPHHRLLGGELQVLLHQKRKNYYVRESVGIAVGFLLLALHEAGLATLTHAPSPMGFLKEILDRPENERPFLLIPVGYPAWDAQVPELTKKRLGESADSAAPVVA